MKAIDVDELWKRIHDTDMEDAVPGYWSLPYDVQKAFDEQGRKIAEIIRSLPVIDTEPVVRCKDCKYKSPCFCTCRAGMTGIVGKTEYCSRGERR